MNLKFWEWFKKEDKLYPPHFAIVELTEVAKARGIKDDFNKEIKRYKFGELVQTVPYSKANMDSIKKVYEIPIYNEEYKEEEDFEFNPFDEISTIKYKQ